mmetsp:Transcript_73528/g.142227  ORF Transcript_73528/g.142227 Transcript_73528/m.142227 type:complete len:183 (-) Transcript_73528:243-791(-)
MALEWPRRSTVPGWVMAIEDLWEATLAGMATTTRTRQAAVARRRVGVAQIERHFPAHYTLNGPTCTICLSVVHADGLCRQTKCGHQFHADCIMKWWTQEKGRPLCCPTCRTTQRVARVVDSEETQETRCPKRPQAQEACQQQQGRQQQQQQSFWGRDEPQEPQQQSLADDIWETLASWCTAD